MRTHGAERDFTGLPTAPHALLFRCSEQSRDLLRVTGPLGGIARARTGCQAPHPASLPVQLRRQSSGAEATRHLLGNTTSQTVLPQKTPPDRQRKPQLLLKCDKLHTKNTYNSGNFEQEVRFAGAQFSSWPLRYTFQGQNHHISCHRRHQGH